VWDIRRNLAADLHRIRAAVLAETKLYDSVAEYHNTLQATYSRGVDMM